MDVSKLVRKCIMKMDSYNIPKRLDVKVKLDQNESPYSIPEAIVEKIRSRFQSVKLNRYNDGNSTELRELIAKRLKVAIDNVAVGVGIDELLYYIMLAFIEKGNKVVRFSPSFEMYKICSTLADALDVSIALNPDFSLHEKFVQESRNAKLVFLCRPNNPTGNSIPLKTVERIAQTSSGLVCIDEAYVDFAGDNCLTLLDYENVIILRTFSKAMSAASVRMGYAIADKRVIESINKVRLPWNIPLFSQIATEEIIKNVEMFSDNIQKIKSERSRLFAEMEKLGITVFPSEANFILFKVKDRDFVFDGLLEQGVLIRSFSCSELKNYLRVTVGTYDENNAFLDALKRCLI